MCLGTQRYSARIVSAVICGFLKKVCFVEVNSIVCEVKELVKLEYASPTQRKQFIVNDLFVMLLIVFCHL